jgi:hypothetical protein
LRPADGARFRWPARRHRVLLGGVPADFPSGPRQGRPSVMERRYGSAISQPTSAPKATTSTRQLSTCGPPRGLLQHLAARCRPLACLHKASERLSVPPARASGLSDPDPISGAKGAAAGCAGAGAACGLTPGGCKAAVTPQFPSRATAATATHVGTCDAGPTSNAPPWFRGP